MPGTFRNIPTALTDAMALGVTTLCVCVLVSRLDGVILGFTTHDEDITFGGVVYEALSSVESTTLRQQIGTGIDNCELMGLLSSARITQSDLRASRYDSAGLDMYVVDWTNVTARVLVMHGSLGELTLTDGQYRAEVRSLMQRYSQQIGSLTSVTCRWRRYGDSDCTAVVHTQSGLVSLLGPVSRIFTVSRASWLSTGTYNSGIARMTMGQNMGIEREVKSATVSIATDLLVELQESFPFPVLLGDSVDMDQGCDHTRATCIGYSNIVNFGGQPYVPGTDILLRTGRHKG